MLRAVRHKAILRAVTGAERVGMDALVELTGASAVTIRRDLGELESLGLVRRVRGGARRPAKRGTDLPFSDRVGEASAVKARLAEVAAGLIEDYESVILDNGTSCLALAHELAGRPLTVLPLSLHAAAALALVPGATVILPGGPVETGSLALQGTATLAAVSRFRADVVVLGACSASPLEGLTSTGFEDAQVKRACVAAASRRILLISADKLSRSSTFHFADIDELTHLVTTDDAPAQALADLAAAGVSLHLAPAPSHAH